MNAERLPRAFGGNLKSGLDIGLGVVAALPAEALPLAQRLPPGGHAKLAGPHSLQLSGMGAANARTAALALADAGCSALLSWGCAGGLAADLPAGALLLPRRICDTHQRSFAATASLHQQLFTLLTGAAWVHTGLLLQVGQAVTSPADKEQLFASSGAIAVDMESAAIAQVAAERGLGFAVLRAVVDPAQRALPQAALAAVNALGQPQWGALLWALLRRPQELPALWQLRADMQLAQAALAQAAQLTGLRGRPGSTLARPVAV